MGTSNTKLADKLHKGRWNSEVELAHAAAAMDSQARHDLVDLLYNRVFATATFLNIKSWEPADLTHSALIEILKSCGGFKGDSSLFKWSDKIVIRTAFQHIRKKKRRAALWENRPLEFNDTAMPDEDLESKFFWQHFLKITKSISEDRRTVFVLHHIHDYSIREISELTGTLPNTVKDRLKHARIQIRKKLTTDPVLKDWIQGRMP